MRGRIYTPKTLNNDLHFKYINNNICHFWCYIINLYYKYNVYIQRSFKNNNVSQRLNFSKIYGIYERSEHYFLCSK